MDKAKQIIRDMLTAIFIASVQVALVTQLPWQAKGLNLPLLVLVFFLSSRPESGLWRWVIGLGLVLDLYSFYPMGYYTGLLLAVALAASWVFRKFFTNQSIFSSLVLTALAFLLFQLLFQLGRYLFGVIDLAALDWIWWRSLAAGLSANLAAAAIGFYLMNIFGSRLQPYFLGHKNI